MVPGVGRRMPRRPEEPSYRFELGGGHWIFGGDPIALAFIRSLAKVREYRRQSSVYFRATNQFVPYPIQDHIESLAPATAAKILLEISRGKSYGTTMEQWLLNNFGPTLCEIFFFPFHELYTASLYHSIAPQDSYKSVTPAGSSRPLGNNQRRGYNPSYLYPEDGLDTLVRRMAAGCRIRYESRVVRVDAKCKEVTLENGEVFPYDVLISTLPLDSILRIANLQTTARPDPHTSVLVLNIGGEKGPQCPDDHWIYTSDGQSGFHRVGFYSNVDASFAPQSAGKNPRVSLYVERAFADSVRPTPAEELVYTSAVIAELQDWGFINEVDVIDPTWIEVAYTWTWPGSKWKSEALALLASYHVHCVGRYARWSFQGIADSIRDGLFAGAATRFIRTPLE
jgi:protoporphyrinogen oxidase